MRGNLSGPVTDPHGEPGRIPDRCPRCQEKATAWTFIGTDAEGRQRFLCMDCVEELKNGREGPNLTPQPLDSRLAER